MGGNKAVFLDRDGTINVDKDYLYRIEDFEYIDGAIEGLKALVDLGYMLVVITNQSGIARGFYTEDDYHRINDWMKRDLASRGIKIEATYFCPHLPEGIVKEYAVECDCRKPATGLFWKAAHDLDIDMDHSIAIGDKQRDLSICKESGVKGILISDIADEDYPSCNSWTDIIEAVKLLSRDDNEFC